MAKTWAKHDWATGKVSLLQAFGIHGAFKFPSLNAKLPSAAAQAQQKSVRHGTPPKNAKQYNQRELQQLWVQAGGDPSKALEASAIAMAESGGRANATNNDSNGSTDKGLWQINTVNGHLSTYNPLKNARSAIELSDNGNNWDPWVTYHNGDYLKYM